MASPYPSRPVSRSVSSQSIPSRRASASVVELSPAEKEKGALITAACRDRDLPALVGLATSTPGLVSDSHRRTACMLLQNDNKVRVDDHRAPAAGVHGTSILPDAVGDATPTQRRASSGLRCQPRLCLLPQEWYHTLRHNIAMHYC